MAIRVAKHIQIITMASLVAISMIAGVIIGRSGMFDFLRYDHYENLDFIDPNTYQAMFLTNDQIYFGRLKNINQDYLILSDVYYVRVDDNSIGQLVKLGQGEPHGPQDKMIISKEQVLFWENLKPDSQVVKTIQNMKLK